MKYQHFAAALGTLIFASSVSAAITYVDATDGVSGNTALAAGGAFTAAVDPAATGTDGLWRKRAFGSSASIFETSGQGTPSEDAPRLVTTVSGLTPGEQYNIYAYFWSPNDVNQQWLLRASLTNPVGDLTLYSRDPSNVPADADSNPVTPDVITPQAVVGDFAVAPTTLSESGRLLWQASLGVAIANGSGQVAVYTDDFATAGQAAPPNGPGTVNHRTWYDGVGYDVVPEPMIAGAFVLAALASAARRRRN